MIATINKPPYDIICLHFSFVLISYSDLLTSTLQIEFSPKQNANEQKNVYKASLPSLLTFIFPFDLLRDDFTSRGVASLVRVLSAAPFTQNNQRKKREIPPWNILIKENKIIHFLNDIYKHGHYSYLRLFKKK